MILKLNIIATMFAINRKYIFKMIYYCVLKHIVTNILNNNILNIKIIFIKTKIIYVHRLVSYLLIILI